MILLTDSERGGRARVGAESWGPRCYHAPMLLGWSWRFQIDGLGLEMERDRHYSHYILYHLILTMTISAVGECSE